MFNPEVQLILTLTICLVSSFGLNKLLEQLKLPSVIAPLAVGLFINAFGKGLVNALPRFNEFVSIFANLGLILLLFFLGLKIHIRFASVSKDSSIMALNAGIVPFALGFYTTYLFGFNPLAALFVGISLAITAEEVSIAILEELNLMKTKLGQVIMEAGVMGDIFEIVTLTILGVIMRSVTSEGNPFVLGIVIELLIFIMVVSFMRFFMVPWLFQLLSIKARNFELFFSSFIILLVTISVSELLNFGYIIGALLAGIILRDALEQQKKIKIEEVITQVVETVSFGFLEPLVFIWIGLSIELSVLFNNLSLGIAFTVVAIIGKIAGSMIGNYFCGKSLRQGFLIGWALNARGATELFAILIAKNIGVVGEEIFAAIVFMTFCTTIISPIVFKFMITKKEWVA